MCIREIVVQKQYGNVSGNRKSNINPADLIMFKVQQKSYHLLFNVCMRACMCATTH